MHVQAFLKAWNETCKVQQQRAILNIPTKTFLLNPIQFSGPCVPISINVQVINLLKLWRTKQSFIQINIAFNKIQMDLKFNI